MALWNQRDVSGRRLEARSQPSAAAVATATGAFGAFHAADDTSGHLLEWLLLLTAGAAAAAMLGACQALPAGTLLS